VTRPELLTEALAEALRPLIAELVEAEVARRLDERERGREEISYLTTNEYADRFKSTPAAVLARIHRGTLHAIRPPGSRPWLIPVDERTERDYDAEQ
jgi:hypothetical protein